MEKFTEKSAIISFDGDISAQTLRKCIKKTWAEFTNQMDNLKILFVCGVHGTPEGKLGEKATSLEDMQQQVSPN